MIIDAKIEFNDDLDPESVQETIFLYLEALDGFVGIEYDAPAAEQKKEIDADGIIALKWCEEEIENVKRTNEREADNAVVDLDALRLLNQNKGLDIAKVIIKGALDHMTASRQKVRKNETKHKENCLS